MVRISTAIVFNDAMNVVVSLGQKYLLLLNGMPSTWQSFIYAIILVLIYLFLNIICFVKLPKLR